MNESQHDRSSASLPSNPFLAAAAAQPPPPSPGLPARKATRSNGEEAPRAPAFPSANLAEPEDGPPPWTLPSAHRPAPVITAPVLPVIPDTAASLARRPQMTTSPSPVRPSTPAAPPAKVEAAPAAGAAPSVPGPMTPALIRDVVEVLEEGQRSLSAAFQSIIQKLENHLSADVPPAVPAPVAIPAVAADTAPVLPPAAAPPPAIERASVAPPPDFELSAAFPPPPPPGQGPLPPVMAPQPVAVPLREVIESHAYAPVPAPEVPAAPPAEAAPARRRFARPNGADARSLSDALAGAFGGIEAPAPPPYTNGGPVHGVGSMPAMDSPFALAEAPVAGVRPTALPQSPFTPPATDSPFALAEETLTQAAAAAAPQPAPFTFLKPLGDHFAPIAGAPMPAAATAAAAYDALDDTPLPWMQPVGGRR